MQPENHHTREPHQPTAAEIVAGDMHVEGCVSALPYAVTLTRIAPGNVEFKLMIAGNAYGTVPFDNLVKAATRIDPDHAVGAEKQIRELREETAKARAAMYDWQAQAEQGQIRIAQLERELAHAQRLLEQSNSSQA